MKACSIKGESERPKRVFAHYVLGRLAFLFFLCHPGTLATFSDGRSYLLNRYPNRDLVTLEGQLEQRRHFTPRRVEEFSMRTGVPDEILNGDTPDGWTPDWAPSLEERFHKTVKCWLHNGLALAKQMRQAKNEPSATGSRSTPSGMAFVPSPTERCKMDLRSARANDQERRRWVSLSEVGSKPMRSFVICPACARRQSEGKGRHSSKSGHGSPSMLLGFRGRRAGRIRFRRILFSGAGSSSGQTGVDLAVAESSPAIAKSPRVSITVTTGAESSKKSAIEPVHLSAKVKLEAKVEAKADVNGRILEASATSVTPLSLVSSLLGGAIDAYDSAVSFVGCVLVTSPLGKRYLNAYDGHFTLPASPVRDGRDPATMTMSCSAYDLVGFSNIDPFEASGRRSGGYSNRVL